MQSICRFIRVISIGMRMIKMPFKIFFIIVLILRIKNVLSAGDKVGIKCHICTNLIDDCIKEGKCPEEFQQNCGSETNGTLYPCSEFTEMMKKWASLDVKYPPLFKEFMHYSIYHDHKPFDRCGYAVITLKAPEPKKLDYSSNPVIFHYCGFDTVHFPVSMYNPPRGLCYENEGPKYYVDSWACDYKDGCNFRGFNLNGADCIDVDVIDQEENSATILITNLRLQLLVFLAWTNIIFG